MTPIPCRSLADILKPALKPCRNFNGGCADICIWQPERGHMPRGFIGATGTATEVRLVLVADEPGVPADGERYVGPPAKKFWSHIDLSARALAEDNLRCRGRSTPFHANLKTILDLCWPGLDLQEQLRLTWLTNSVKCSVQASPEEVAYVAKTCIASYLKRELDALPHAFVLVLGDKARDRLQRAGIRTDSVAQHPSAPPNTHPYESWNRAAREFRAWLTTH